MKIIENIILQQRANKSKKKDEAGIGYIISSIGKGQTAMDIGVFKAGYLYWMVKQVGETGKVYAFEPQSRLYKYIKKIKRLLNWKNVSIEHLALSDTAGTVKLYIPTNKAWKKYSPGATIAGQKASQDTISATETVATETLDAYCGQHAIAPDFLKIDVEGNELRVLRGGIETLKKYKPKVFVEIEARHVGEEIVSETFEYMESLGYKGQFIHRTAHYLPLSSFSFEKHQNISDKENYCNNFIFE